MQETYLSLGIGVALLTRQLRFTRFRMKDRPFENDVKKNVVRERPGFNYAVEMINRKQLVDYGESRHTDNTGNRSRKGFLCAIQEQRGKQWCVEQTNRWYIPNKVALSFAVGARPPFLSQPLGTIFKC